LTPNQRFAKVDRSLKKQPEFIKNGEFKNKARKEAISWWMRHGHDVSALAQGELRSFARDLCEGSPGQAKFRMLARAPRVVWVAYRNSVTRKAMALASRRVRVMRALEFLGFAAARLIASALISAL